jgi:hypothetical protein
MIHQYLINNRIYFAPRQNPLFHLKIEEFNLLTIPIEMVPNSKKEIE